jgi:spermidine synthase
MPFLLALVFCFSGAAALVYEVAWVRMLANGLGASSYTVGTVLAAFMGGLALGARWIGRRADRDARPLRTYARLEAGIALCAVLIPFAFGALPALNRLFYGALEGHLWALTLARCAVALVALIVPTALMGATFPAMASAVASEGHRGWRIGLLYGANTLGAVAGVLLAGFWMIGHLGLRWTTWTAALANLAAAGAAAILAARKRPRPVAPEGAGPAPEEEEEEASVADRRLALAAAAMAGFVSLGFEVLWTRMFSVLFASVTYSFAMMLATFLLGLALGAPAFGRLSDARRDRLEWAGLVQLAAAAAALAAFLVFPTLKTATGTTSLAFGGPRWSEYLTGFGLDAARVMLVPALLMGGVLPILTRVLAQGPARGLASRLGRIYAANTVGAMAGSLLTGFVLIPWLGRFAWVSLALAILSALTGAALVFRGGSWRPLSRWLAAGVAAAALAGVASITEWRRPVLFEKAVVSKGGVIPIWYEEGPSLTVAVVEDTRTKDRMMYTDSFHVAGTGDTYEYMRMIAHLPMLLNPDAKSACVVGLGTGTTAGALTLWPLDRIDVVELCPEIARGARYFGSANRDLMDRLKSDGRLRLVFDDGKAFLRSTRGGYDVIVAEPLNPHMSGAASLYCREFYDAARARLNRDGVVVQWIPLHGVKPEDFRSLFRTFVDAFPESAAWYFKEAILLTGHESAFRIRITPFRKAHSAPQTQAELIALDLHDLHTLLASFVCGPKKLRDYARYAKPVTDDLPHIEYFRPGQPVAFAERENLDGLRQHREEIAPYCVVGGTTPEAARAAGKLFGILAVNHFKARGEYIEARLLELDAERARSANDLRAAQQLYSAAADRLRAGANLASNDRYVARHLLRYEPKEKDFGELTPEKAQRAIELSKGTTQDKVAACQMLEKFADWRAGEITKRLSSDPAEEVRLAAVKALGPMGRNEAAEHPAGTDILCAEVLRDVLVRAREDKGVRIQCLESLRVIGAPAAQYFTAVFPLKGQSGSEDWEIRSAAVAHLREIGTLESLGFLFLVLDDADVRVRGEAVVALANSKQPMAVPGLLEALKDPEPVVRRAAADGLKKITGIGLEWEWDAPEDVRGAAALAWERWYDSYERSRRWAAECGRMDPEMLQLELGRLFRDRPEPDREDWKRVVEEFARFRDEKATPAPSVKLLQSEAVDGLLRRLQDDPDLWLGVVILEQKIGMERGVVCRSRQPPPFR